MNFAPIPKHLQDHCEIVGGLAVPRVVAKGTAGRMVLKTSTYPHFDEMICWEGSNEAWDFGRYDDEKKRQCIIESRCHVCWEASADPLICEPKGMKALRPVTYGRAEGVLMNAPWVCPICLLYASKTCPHLVGNANAQVFYMREHKVIGTAYKPVDPTDPVPLPGSKALLTFRVLALDCVANPLSEWAAKAERRYG